MLEALNKANPRNEIHSVDSSRLAPYGRIVDGADYGELFAPSLAMVDLTGPAYLRDVPVLHSFPSINQLKTSVYGSAAIQAGLCFGLNSKMNGMEYHRGSEVIIGVTDSVLILGLSREIRENSWDSSRAECFYLPRGRALELYDGTLHLAPCRVTEDPFCTVIVLPDGTNSPLEQPDRDDPLHFMTNKWLICHEESPAVSKGGFVGITGANIEITPLPLS